MHLVLLTAPLWLALKFKGSFALILKALPHFYIFAKGLLLENTGRGKQNVYFLCILLISSLNYVQFSCCVGQDYLLGFLFSLKKIK